MALTCQTCAFGDHTKLRDSTSVRDVETQLMVTKRDQKIKVVVSRMSKQNYTYIDLKIVLPSLTNKKIGTSCKQTG